MTEADARRVIAAAVRLWPAAKKHWNDSIVEVMVARLQPFAPVSAALDALSALVTTLPRSCPRPAEIVAAVRAGCAAAADRDQRNTGTNPVDVLRRAGIGSERDSQLDVLIEAAATSMRRALAACGRRHVTERCPRGIGYEALVLGEFLRDAHASGISRDAALARYGAEWERGGRFSEFAPQAWQLQPPPEPTPEEVAEAKRQARVQFRQRAAASAEAV
jgi:hypothetical protein